MNVEKLVTWFGHSSFCLNLEDGRRIYFDPWKLPTSKLPIADIVFISHPHPDHYSIEDIKSIVGANTKIVAHPACNVDSITTNVEYVKPGEKLVLDCDIVVDVVPAHNVNKWRSPGIAFHPKESLFNGYVIKLDGDEKLAVYFAGDTDIIEEMTEIGASGVDIAFLPISGTYVMTAQEAAIAATIIKPRLAAIPMHYGTIVGTDADAKEFQKLVGEKHAIILQKLI